MSNFQFADKFGFTPPVMFEDKREGYYNGLINFIALFDYIKKGIKNNDIEPFDYKKFVSKSKITITAREQQAMFATKDFLFFKDKKYDVSIPYETISKSGKKINLQPKTRLDKKLEKIHFVPDYYVFFDYKKERVLFYLGYKYLIGREYAILITSEFFDQFEKILEFSNYNISDAGIETEIIKQFKKAFNVAKNDANQLDWIYEKAPNFAIVSRGSKGLINDLSLILESFVDEIGTNEEKVVLKILNALAVIYLKEAKGVNLIGKGADKLLKVLISKKVNNKTIFERLYSKMNDKGFGESNFSELMKFLHRIWFFSSWSNQNEYDNKDTTGVENLAYTNKRILGYNSNDYNFKFINSKDNKLIIDVTKTVRTGGSFREGSGSILIEKINQYHPYQPIRLPEIPEKGDFEIDNTIIPAFFLKAFDDKGAWENFEKASWLALDVITTFTGVGNLLKFRHLIKLRKLAGLTKLQKVLFTLKFSSTLVEVTSGTLGIILEFTDNCNSSNKQKKELCQQLRTYLFILDMASLGIDSVVERLLKRQAEKTVKAAEKLAKKSKDTDELEKLDEIMEHFDEVANTTTKRYRKTQKYWDNFMYTDLFKTPPKKPCFLAGTQIHTTNGLKPIETIKKGDTVFCYNELTQKLTQQQVSEIFTNFTEKYVEITTKNGNKLAVTGQHLFYQKTSETYIKAYQLKIGMHLYNPITNTLEKITNKIVIDKKVTTYNFEVPTHHNYIVGKTGVLVHNANKSQAFTSTDKFKVAFYKLNLPQFKDANLNAHYIGKTTRPIPTRGQEHYLEGIRALNSNNPKLKQKWAWKADKEISALTDFIEMTPFESAVWEQYYINQHGGKPSKTNINTLLKNKKNAITEAKFVDIKKQFKNFNPCKYF